MTFARAWRWVYHWFMRTEPVAPSQVPPSSFVQEPEDEFEEVLRLVALIPAATITVLSEVRVDPVVVVKPVVKKPKPKEEADTIEWAFRETILDRLDEYFQCLTRLKKYEPDAYDAFSRLGFAIPASCINPEYPNIRETQALRRTLGGVLLWGDMEDEENIYPSFVYFTKMRCPMLVEAAKGVIYRVTVVYDERGVARKLTLPLSCHIALTDDGAVRLLREPYEDYSDIGKGRHRFRLKTTQWAYPRWSCDLIRRSHRTEKIS